MVEYYYIQNYGITFMLISKNGIIVSPIPSIAKKMLGKTTNEIYRFYPNANIVKM